MNSTQETGNENSNANSDSEEFPSTPRINHLSNTPSTPSTPRMNESLPRAYNDEKGFVTYAPDMPSIEIHKRPLTKNMVDPKFRDEIEDGVSYFVGIDKNEPEGTLIHLFYDRSFNPVENPANSLVKVSKINNSATKNFSKLNVTPLSRNEIRRRMGNSSPSPASNLSGAFSAASDSSLKGGRRRRTRHQKKTRRTRKSRRSLKKK
jgi:hypothetical protein